MGQPKFWTQLQPVVLSENVEILPWCGRQNTRHIAEARARLIQQPKRQGHKLAKVASHVWTMFAGLQSCIRSPRFFGYKKSKREKKVSIWHLKPVLNSKDFTWFQSNNFPPFLIWVLNSCLTNLTVWIKSSLLFRNNLIKIIIRILV